VDVPTEPSNFEGARLRERIRHYEGDVRDRARLGSVLEQFRPDFVFHLAAQSLVRRSYADPVKTFEVNSLGTANVLECLRERHWIKAAVLVTSDKCYRNVEWVWGYRETDALGGDDPYSASKACAELIAHAYFQSFLQHGSEGPRVATARAGNVIGGGDWAPDRIVPDCVRSWTAGQPVVIRNPRATRPWQHVLEPLSGYLWLGRHLAQRDDDVAWTSYNFGPDAAVTASVQTLIQEMARYWPGARWETEVSETLRKEATLLKLACDKALRDLGWRAVLTFGETVRFTADWYQRYYADPTRDMFDTAVAQIREYAACAKERDLEWSS
jgi:CDP-glucose 4,6-dehydratase